MTEMRRMSSPEHDLYTAMGWFYNKLSDSEASLNSHQEKVEANEFDAPGYRLAVSEYNIACRQVARDEAAIAHWKRYRWTAIKKQRGA